MSRTGKLARQHSSLLHPGISVSSPRPGQFVTVFENITELKQTEKTLRLRWFSVACRSLGYSEQELLAMTLVSLLPALLGFLME